MPSEVTLGVLLALGAAGTNSAIDASRKAVVMAAGGVPPTALVALVGKDNRSGGFCTGRAPAK